MVSQIVDKPNIELMWGLFYMFLILILIAEGNYGQMQGVFLCLLSFARAKKVRRQPDATGTTAMVQGKSASPAKAPKPD